MEFVADWDATRARHDAWWKRELDTPLVTMQVRRETPRWPLRSVPQIGDDWDRQMLDAEVLLARIENAIATHDYVADGFPTLRRGYNTGTLGIFSGARMEAADGTVWIHPTVEDWASESLPKFDPQAPMHRKTAEIDEQLWDSAKDRWVLGIPDHLDAVTTMSSMRGAEAFIFDILEDPEPLLKYRDALVDVWIESHRWWVERDHARGCGGHSGWHHIWSSEGHDLIQADVCAMLSPPLFRQAVLPELQREATYLRSAVYHLDGKDELVHLDDLLEVPEITCIQWQPGDGAPHGAHWPEVLRKIQDAGKNLQLFVWPEDVEALVQNAKPAGCMLFFVRSLEPEEADHVLKRLADWQ